MFKKAFSALLAGVIAASAAVASAGCLTVGAGAVTKKITYTGHDHDILYIPPIYIYDNAENDKFISSDGYESDCVIEMESSKAEHMLMDDIKPTDVVTFSVITESGDEEILDVCFGTTDYKSPILTSYIVGRRLGVFRSGVTVQEMIDQYNSDIAEVHWLKEFNDVKDITFKNISSIYAYKDYSNIKDYGNFTWKITIEPGSNSNNAKQSDISSLTFGKIANKAYTGKAITPAVTVKDDGKKLTEGTDYTISYKNNTKIGTASATITGKGDYSGTKTVKFKIVPKKAKLSGSVSDTKAALSWNKSKGATGYEVYCSVDGGKFTKLKTTKALKYTARLAKGKSYQFKVRPYTLVNGKKVYGSWSNVFKAN